MADFESLEKKIDVLGEAIKLTASKMDEGFKRVDERFGELEAQIDTLAISTAKEFNTVHKDIGEIKEKVTNLEKHADIVDQKLERLDRNIGTLMDSAASHETRITKLEAVA